MRIETKYICDYCEFKHRTLKEVTDCETSCKEKIKKFDVIKFEFYHEIGKIKKFDTLEDRLKFLEDKLNKLTYYVLTIRSPIKEISHIRQTMFKVCNSLNCKINFLKNTIKKRRSIYNGVANT